MSEFMISMAHEVAMIVSIAIGTSVVAYFRKVQKTQKSLCETVERLQKTIIILSKAIDRQSNRLHPKEAKSDLDDLVKELLDK
jgi:hypothetical protein|tara:strand:+ start:59 stop:307 length:249 start_codon:yes stop_codon:yes gene_type:complete